MMVVTQETLSVSGITLSKLYGGQGAEVGRFQEANSRLAAAATQQQAIGQAFFSVVQTFLGVTPVIVYLVVGLLLNRGTDLTAGTVVAFTTLQNRLFFPVARMLETTVELQSSRVMFRRIFEYLDTTPDIVERPDAVELDSATGRGEIRSTTSTSPTTRPNLCYATSASLPSRGRSWRSSDRRAPASRRS